MKNQTLRLATRTSPLALYQAELVATRLRAAHLDLVVELVAIESAGDKDIDRPIREFAARGAFSTAVDRLVSEDRADVAVHSAKDLPASIDDDGMFLLRFPIAPIHAMSLWDQRSVNSVSERPWPLDRSDVGRSSLICGQTLDSLIFGETSLPGYKNFPPAGRACCPSCP